MSTRSFTTYLLNAFLQLRHCSAPVSSAYSVVWEAQTGQDLVVRSMALSPDGKPLASVCDDKTVKV
jgi:hypothetical protein